MAWYRLFFLFVLCLPCSLCFGQTIHIEPPFWWAGMNNADLQLLCHGDSLGMTEVEIQSPDVRLESSGRLDGVNYIVLNLRINSGAKPGKFDIRFNHSKDHYSIIPYELKKRDVGSRDRKGFGHRDVLYLVTPDRFANGDMTNDVIEGMKEGVQPNAEYGRHGGDLKGIENHLDYIKSMGFTAVWLNPILENDQHKWSYHGYATTDYYEVDPRFGSNEQYRSLSKKAKEMGIGMIMDIIVNHCGDQHTWMADPPSKDWFNHQDQPYLETNHRKETLLDPYGSKEDRYVMTNGWFVPAMPDLNQRNPVVSKYLIQNSIWWIEYADLYGIRQDTYSYPYREFMADWTCAIQDEFPNFNIVGEEWVDDPAIISYWQMDKKNQDGYTSCLPSLMDFPLCFSISKALTQKEGFDEGFIQMYRTLSKDYLYPHPENLVIFGDNHDMSRIFTRLDEDYDLFKLAMIYLMTTRGIPQIYYGTEILMSNKGTDSHGVIRADFPGGWPNDSMSVINNINIPTTATNAQRFIRDLIHWRKDEIVIHEGKLMHFLPKDNVYVYFRYNDDEKLMVVLNKNEQSYALKLNRFKEILECPTQGYSVLEKKSVILSDELLLEPMTSYVIKVGG